jgi:hypothetical protein
LSDPDPSDPRVAVVYGKQRRGPTKFSERQIFQQWFPDKSYLLSLRPSATTPMPRSEEVGNGPTTGLPTEDVGDWYREGHLVSYQAEQKSSTST